MDKLEMARQTRAALLAFVSGATTLTDEQAMNMASTFPVWPEGVNSDGQYVEGQIVQDEGQIYRVMQPTVTPIENQPPHAEGMLAVYRPIEVEHTGTIDDPIPWVYGMDCYNGKYYSYEGKVYLCKGDMIPCVWTPGSAGLWQWEEVTAEPGGETEPEEPVTEPEEPGTGETTDPQPDPEPEPEPEEPVELDGSLENPIPFELNMNVQNGKYYSYNGKVYLCKLDMAPCVWAPGTPGLWQWEKVTADDSSPEEAV